MDLLLIGSVLKFFFNYGGKLAQVFPRQPHLILFLLAACDDISDQIGVKVVQDCLEHLDSDIEL